MGLLPPVYAGVVKCNGPQPIQHRHMLPKGDFTVNTQLTTQEVSMLAKALGNKDDREAINGYDSRKAKRESLKESTKSAKALRKEMKKADKSTMSDAEKKAHEESLKALNKDIKKIAAAAREFGAVDSITAINAFVNTAMSAGGGAIAAHVTDGDYLPRIVSNVVGCVGVDLLSTAVQKYITGTYGDEDWKRWTHKTLRAGFEVGGAAAVSAAVAHYGFGKCPYEAAVTAAGTQVAKRGLEWVRNSIMEW